MADKRISQLIERVDIANNDVLPIVASGATTTNKVTISTIQEWMQDNLDVGVTSVGITLGSSGTDISVSGSPITTSGNITINIPTASATNRGLLSAADWSTFNNKVPYTGATGNVDLGEYGLDAGFLNLDTSPTGTPTSQGTIYWDTARSTAALIMNGTTQHIGQDSFFYVKNSTGSTITKGTCVGFAGTDGASGHLLISPYLANGTNPSTYFMGVTCEEITNGSFGQVMHFGELTGVNTSGYTAGALLYASTSVAGAFQTTAPQAPNNIILVAAAVNSTNNGTIVVRPQLGSNINTDEGVKITSVVPGDILQFQNGTYLWENKSIDDAGIVTKNTNQTITGVKTFSGSSLRLAANGTADAVVLRNVSGTTGSDTGATTMGFNGSDNLFISTQSRGGFILSFNNSVSNRTYTLPDTSGTFALGTGTTNFIPKYTSGGSALIGNSTIQDSGSAITLGNPTNVIGTLGITGALNGTSASFSGALTAGTFNQDSPVILSTNNVVNKPSLTIFKNTELGTENVFLVQSFFGGSGVNNVASIKANGAATFSSSVTAGGNILTPAGSGLAFVGDTSRIITPEDNVSGALIQTPGIIRFNAGGTSTRVTITAAGNVGIGTASPGQKLTLINGTFQIGGSSTFVDNVEIGRVGGDNNMGFATGGTERMRITSGGNVLINKTSDDGSRLQVNGIISQNNYTYHLNSDGGNLAGATWITTGITLPANHLGSYEVYINGNENGQNQCIRIYNIFYNTFTGWGAVLVSTNYIGNDYGWVDLRMTSGGTIQVKAGNNVSTGIYRISLTKQFKN